MDRIEVSISNIKLGKNCVIISPVNIYGCKLGDNCFVGPFVEIQKNVTIGDNTKIQSHSFVCELVSIGRGCFISHGVMFVNDLFLEGGPAGGDKSQWKNTHVGDNVSIGSNATILPVSICSNVVIGAGSVVSRDISVPGVYLGNAARLSRRF